MSVDLVRETIKYFSNFFKASCKCGHLRGAAPNLPFQNRQVKILLLKAAAGSFSQSPYHRLVGPTPTICLSHFGWDLREVVNTKWSFIWSLKFFDSILFAVHNFLNKLPVKGTRSNFFKTCFLYVMTHYSTRFSLTTNPILLCLKKVIY